ncbi:MAG TPA: type II toxin-antitoxin system prevent-host-death family antitoxin [Nitrospirota bacterium]|nr:type II toxin-antitoxin system prevent-host-death family antitoxin [Nitrospirota bacterium]
MTPLRFLTVTELQRKLMEVIREIEKTGKEVIISRNGKPVVIMQRVSEQDLSFNKPKKK